MLHILYTCIYIMVNVMCLGVSETKDKCCMLCSGCIHARISLTLTVYTAGSGVLYVQAGGNTSLGPDSEPCYV